MPGNIRGDCLVGMECALRIPQQAAVADEHGLGMKLCGQRCLVRDVDALLLAPLLLLLLQTCATAPCARSLMRSSTH